MSTTTARAAEAPTTNRRSRRDRERLKKQRQRDTQREAAKIAAIEEAKRKENLAEFLAPLVMRTPILSADGRMLVGPRVQIIDGKAVRENMLMTDPVNTLRLKHNEKRAALRLQADWRDVGAGLSLGAVDYLRTGGHGGDGPAGHEAMLEQIATRQRLDGAMAYLGAFAPSIARVVLDGIPVSYWAEEVGKTREEARAWIAAGLERLDGFYFPPAPPTGDRIPVLTFGPPREDYDLSTDPVENK